MPLMLSRNAERTMPYCALAWPNNRLLLKLGLFNHQRTFQNFAFECVFSIVFARNDFQQHDGALTQGFKNHLLFLIQDFDLDISHPQWSLWMILGKLQNQGPLFT